MPNPNESMIGYLEAKVEVLEKKVEAIDEKLDRVLDQLSTYRTIIRTLRALGMAFVFLLTLKLGDFTDIIRRIVKGTI